MEKTVSTWKELDLRLEDNKSITIFAVGDDDLPPDTWALIGNKDLRELFVSLDFAQAHPGQPLRYAPSKPSLEGSFPPFGANFESHGERFAGFSLVLALAVGALLCAVSHGLFESWTDSSGLSQTLILVKCLTALLLSRLVWMVPEWVLFLLCSKDRPPAGEGERPQAQPSPTGIRKTISSAHLRSHGTRPRLRLSARQSALSKTLF